MRYFKLFLIGLLVSAGIVKTNADVSNDKNPSKETIVRGGPKAENLCFGGSPK